MGTQEILQRKGWKVKRKASGGKTQLRTQVDTLSDTNATTSVSLDDEYSSKKGGTEERCPDGATRGLRTQGLIGMFVEEIMYTNHSREIIDIGPAIRENDYQALSTMCTQLTSYISFTKNFEE